MAASPARPPSPGRGVLAGLRTAALIRSAVIFSAATMAQSQVEVPITFTDRTHGQSKMAGGIVNEAFWLVWRLWLQNGLRRSPRKKA